MNEERLEALLEKATVACYGEYEEFARVLYTLGHQLRFPLKATVVGELVEVLGLDNARSDLRCGIVARVRRGEKEYRVGLSELRFVDPDPASAEWLEVYEYWLVSSR